MVNWIKENWKDPVWSKVFATGIIAVLSFFISGIWIIITGIFSDVSLYDSFVEFLEIISVKIPVPLWLILISLISTIVLIAVKQIKSKCYSIKKVDDGETVDFSKITNNVKVFESNNIGLAKPNFNSGITSDFLKSKHGIFNIWGYISDIHNKIHPKRRFMYLVGYATNGGNPLNNPNLAEYPNTWSIARLTPTAEDNNGVWRFWCNSIEKEITVLDFNKPISGGWHLFSIAWSNENNYIKFLIDSKIVAEGKYINWPSDLSSSIHVGTWANKAVTHYFDSKVGPWSFVESNFNSDLIKSYYNKKPE